VHVSVSLRLPCLSISDDLARKNVSEEAKGIVKLLVVNRLVEVLDENVPNTRTTKRGVTLAPHDTAWLSLDHGEVHGIESTFSVIQLVIVDIRVTEGATSNSVTAHTNRGNVADSVEDLEQQTFVDIGGKVSDVKRSGMECTRTFTSRRGCRHRSRDGGSWTIGRGFTGFIDGSRHGDFELESEETDWD
jgi:hypothetical protein